MIGCCCTNGKKLGTKWQLWVQNSSTENLKSYFIYCLGSFLTFESDEISRNHEAVLVVNSIKRSME